MTNADSPPQYLKLSDLPAEIQAHIAQALYGARQQMVDVGESDPAHWSTPA